MRLLKQTKHWGRMGQRVWHPVARTSMVGLVGLSLLQCLRLNEEHCALNGGDFACGGQGYCILVIGTNGSGGSTDDAAVAGCAASLSDVDVVHAEFGLPAALARTSAMSGTNADVRTVEGVVIQRLQDEGAAGECPIDLTTLGEVFPTLDAVIQLRQRLGQRNRVRVANVQISEKEGEAVRGFNEDMRSFLDACIGTGAATGTGTEGETESTSLPTGDTGSSTTGPGPCVSDDHCQDTAAPFCNPQSGQCVSCDGLTDGDAACAGTDSGNPLCINSRCVECSDTDTSVCDAQLLICDGQTNVCVGCSEHNNCLSGICSIAVGQCFPPDGRVHVDGDGGQDFASISAAVDNIAPGMYGVIVVHQRDNGAPYTGSITVGQDKSIVLLAADGETPVIQGTGSNPGLHVEGQGTAPYIDGLEVSGANAEGLVVDGAFAWVERSHIIRNSNGGILAQNGAELTVSNCFVGDWNYGANSLVVENASASILYSTLGTGYEPFGEVYAILCISSFGVTVRNSMILSYDNVMEEVSCGTSEMMNVASQTLLPGMGNVALGSVAADWFVDIIAGDFHINNLPDVATVARWEDGDPRTDIDGDSRPSEDGSPDYAGADIP